MRDVSVGMTSEGLDCLLTPYSALHDSLVLILMGDQGGEMFCQGTNGSSGMSDDTVGYLSLIIKGTLYRF